MVTLYDIYEKIHRLEQQGRDVIEFNVGDPDQMTDERIIKACIRAMRKGFTKYGSAAGEMFLRRKIADEHGTRPENVMISPGSKFSIFAAMDKLLGHGDNVVIPSPHWNAYTLIAERLGARVKLVNTGIKDRWKVHPEAVEEAIDGRTRAIILCNPNNPTSTVMDEKALTEIIGIAERRRIPIISDESYADISFKEVGCMADSGVGNICVKSFSKTFAMTGWRIGYMIASEETVRHAMKLVQITTTNVPLFVQYAASEALDLRSEIAASMRRIYKKRAEEAVRTLGATELAIYRPDAPFYLFPYCNGDSEKLAMGLVDKGVGVVPGTAFGDYRGHFRIALTVPDGKLRKGLGILAGEFARRRPATDKHRGSPLPRA